MKKLFILLSFLCVAYTNEVRSSWFGDLFKDAFIDTTETKFDQTDDNVIVTMNVPDDIDPDNIHVEIKDKTLYVYGERKLKQEVKEESRHYVSMSSSSFNRILSLPCLVDEAGTTAEITEGVLVITMPKIKEDVVTKKIKVVKAKK